jgi:FXSXX-COOH protein
MMNSIPVDAEPDVESELVDLGAVPLTVLRELDHAALHRAMRRVVERTRALRVIRAVAMPKAAAGGSTDQHTELRGQLLGLLPAVPASRQLQREVWCPSKRWPQAMVSHSIVCPGPISTRWPTAMVGQAWCDGCGERSVAEGCSCCGR